MEFGYLAQVVDNAGGVVVDHSVHVSNPPDGPLLAPAIARVKALTGRPPRAVAADRGYGDAKVGSELSALGVTFVAIIRKGRRSRARQSTERSRRSRKLVKWRTGSEARVSTLKRSYGWSRCLMDGIDGARLWCGYGVFAHNANKISGLMAGGAGPEKAKASPPRRCARPVTGPPGRGQPPPELPISA